MMAIRRGFRRLGRRFLPQRQILFRVRGEFDVITLSPQRQLLTLAGALLLGCWVMFSTFHYLAFDWMLRMARDGEGQAREAYGRADADRGRLMQERKALESKVQRLELTLAVLQVSQEKVVMRLITRTRGRIDEASRLIEMTGLDVDRFLGGAGDTSMAVGNAAATGQALGSEGGPFVAATAPVEPKDPLRARVADLDRQLVEWDRLRKAVSALPLAAPLDQYRETSGFGPRRDPVNGRAAVHHGVDLADARGTPVLAPAPGTVVFAGRDGQYGRMIEIDHGYGLHTRYGHLSRVSVHEGEWVGYRQKIGKVGSTGRSTGPHLHYEVLVNGWPRDPLTFIEAGKYIFKDRPLMTTAATE